MYVCVCMYVCMYVYIYIYIYIYIYPCAFAGFSGPSSTCTRWPSEKGTNGVGTNGVTTNLLFLFDRGAFWALPLTYFYLPKSARAHLFPQPVKTHYLCGGPIIISVGLICRQPRMWHIMVLLD